MLLMKDSTVEAFDRFAELPHNRDKKLEWLDGEIIEVPSNPYSSKLAIRIAAPLLLFVDARDLGHVTGEQGGYIVAGARLAPDVAYISKIRQPELETQTYNPKPPNLAVEVMSPSDDPDVLDRKLKKYAEAGVLVWVFDPPNQRVRILAPGQPEQVIERDGTLDGGDVLPGFTLALKDVFK
jgi:Uma2 family endonuclease